MYFFLRLFTTKINIQNCPPKCLMTFLDIRYNKNLTLPVLRLIFIQSHFRSFLKILDLLSLSLILICNHYNQSSTHLFHQELDNGINCIMLYLHSSRLKSKKGENLGKLFMLYCTYFFHFKPAVYVPTFTL